MYSMFTFQHIIVPKRTMHPRQEVVTLFFFVPLCSGFLLLWERCLFSCPEWRLPVSSLQNSHFKFKCSLTLTNFFPSLSLCLSLQSPDVETLNQPAVRQHCAGLEEQARVCYFYRPSLSVTLCALIIGWWRKTGASSSCCPILKSPDASCNTDTLSLHSRGLASTCLGIHCGAAASNILHPQ